MGNPLKDGKGKDLTILGSEIFIENMKNKLEKITKMERDRELPTLRLIKEKPAMENIYACVNKTFRGNKALIRNATIFIAHKNTDYKMIEIAEFFGVSISVVEYGYNKIRTLLSCEKELAKLVEEAEALLSPPPRFGVKPTDCQKLGNL